MTLMAPWHWSYRTVFLVGSLVCLILLGDALYVERHASHTRCISCLLQGVAFLWMGLWFLIGGWHAPRGGRRWVYAALVVLGALAGVVMASRQLWLQSLPACGAGECAQTSRYFLGLSMTGWALIWYVLLTAFAIHGAVHPFSPRQIARMHQTQP